MVIVSRYRIGVEELNVRTAKREILFKIDPPHGSITDRHQIPEPLLFPISQPVRAHRNGQRQNQQPAEYDIREYGSAHRLCIWIGNIHALLIGKLTIRVRLEG